MDKLLKGKDHGAQFAMDLMASNDFEEQKCESEDEEEDQEDEDEGKYLPNIRD